MAQQGASRLVVLAVLFAGFYIDDRHVSVPGIDCYDLPATNGCCHYVDGKVHTEERRGNMLDAMKRLGLEGRVHLE